MPISYGFHDAKDGKMVDLDQVEKEFAKALEDDNKQTCTQDLATLLLFYSGLYVYDNGTFDQKRFDKSMESEPATRKALFLKFLKTKYVFFSYRTAFTA